MNIIIMIVIIIIIIIIKINITVYMYRYVFMYLITHASAPGGRFGIRLPTQSQKQCKRNTSE